MIVHSAGGALGLERVAEADEDRWREMFESNVLGVVRVTKALLPALRRGDRPDDRDHRLVAGVEVYEGGGGTPPPSTPRTRSPRRCGSSCIASTSG